MEKVSMSAIKPFHISILTIIMLQVCICVHILYMR